MYSIKNLPPEQQPREKLELLGVEGMSLDELLAIILSTGYKGEDVLTLSQRILSDYGVKSITGYTAVADVMKDFSLPKVKSCQLLACMEIGRRVYGQNAQGIIVIQSPEDVWKYVSDMYTLKKEYLRGIYLNTKYRILHDETISIGTLDQSLGHPREVFAPALKYSAAAIILVHNHPSGDTMPSVADRELTERMQRVGEEMGIPILDHIVVSQTGYHSIISS